MRSLVFVFVLMLCFGSLSVHAGQETASETAYDRVMRTRTLRCGYIVWAPMFMKDPNTGKLSGIFHDYTEELAAVLSLKIDWAEELTPATYVEALKFGRVDMLCSGDWPNATRGQYLIYAPPIFYTALVPYVREKDARFDGHPEKLDDKTVALSVIDGEMSSIVARQDFPAARRVELPQTADAAQMMMQVKDGKADATIAAVGTGMRYIRANPGTVRAVKDVAPFRLFPNTLSVRMGENNLREMMATATQEALNSGRIEKILRRYEEFPGELYRVARPYDLSR
jgi:ABC-type amino acid transport substrate-binding protein